MKDFGVRKEPKAAKSMELSRCTYGWILGFLNWHLKIFAVVEVIKQHSTQHDWDWDWDWDWESPARRATGLHAE